MDALKLAASPAMFVQYYMASRFTIYSINQISDLIDQISYIIYKISDILY